MNPTAIVASAYYPPHKGGVEMYTVGLVHELNRRGWDVDLLTSSIGHPPGLRPSTPGPGRMRLAYWDVAEVLGRMPVPTATGHNLALVRRLRSTTYSLAVIQSHLYPAHALLARSLGAQTPVIILGHGSAPVPSSSRLLNRGLQVAEWALARAMSPRASATFGVSRASAEWMSQLGFHVSGSVGNATVPPLLPSPPRRENAPLRVAYVGRMEPGKGADAAIRIVAETAALAEKERPLHLTIAGAGSQQDLISQAAAEYPDLVTYTGTLSHEQVRRLLNESDVLLFPSKYPEGFPTIMLEAGAAGCALVTYPVAGSEELLSQTGAGWIVADEAEAVETLRRLIDDRESVRQAGRTASDLVRAEYTWKRVVDRLLEGTVGAVGPLGGTTSTSSGRMGVIDREGSGW